MNRPGISEIVNGVEALRNGRNLELEFDQFGIEELKEQVIGSLAIRNMGG